jgi:hypothetical protein
MSKLHHTQHGTITTVAGTASVTLVCKDSTMMKVFVKPTTATTTFDIKLTDIYSNDTFERLDIVELLNENGIEEPMYGDVTFTIQNASADEDFYYLIVFDQT